MDTSTVAALCTLLLVVIGIVEISMRRRKWRTISERKK